MASFTTIGDLPDIGSIVRDIPPLPEHRVDAHREELAAILRGDDERKFFVVGPCSAWPFDAVREYADRLASLQDEVREHVVLVMRTYIQKPRTTVGWSGPINFPDPCGPADMHRGIRLCRKMMSDVAKQLPIADEVLFTDLGGGFDDLLSYHAIGARSSEDMPHRFVASGLPAPTGIKNGTSGDIRAGVNGIVCAQASHIFPRGDKLVKSSGNPYAHLILRGGGGHTNYDAHSIAQADTMLREAKVQNPAIVVDASHDNSMNGHGKDPTLQRLVIRSVLLGIEERREEYDRVVGFMAESFLKDGAQKIAPAMDLHGLSITDPCLGWEKTERLIRTIADTLDAVRGSPVSPGA